MELRAYAAAAAVALLLCFSSNFIQSPSDVLGPVALLEPTPAAARDFGGVVSDAPLAVLRPGSPSDIARLLSALSTASAAPRGGPRAAVAARGAGHSLHGQAQACGGIVVETRALPRAVEVVRADGDGEEGGSAAYADVGGGALWVDVLEECLRAGLAPRSWTDYLYLTVGGTLSNAGISGQAFKHGPQISNVLQLEVVTGRGEVVTCSPTTNPELFFAVLGGLGQFGIITRARIPLQVAPSKVRWVRAFYDSFQTFTADQELLISTMTELVDYVEGFMVLDEQSLHSSSVAFPAQVNFSPDFGEKVYYCVEFAVHDFQHQGSSSSPAEHVVELVSSRLSYLRPHMYSVDVSYFDFLNRVRMEEESLRGRGLWDVPHPWLNVFVPKHGVDRFKDLLMDTITPGDFEGPVIVYPLLTDRWDRNTSAVVPSSSDGVMYIFSVLRSTDPARCGRACVEGIMEQHRRVTDEACRDEKDGGISAKQYLARQPSPAHWRDHFGSSWDRFAARKARFDPMHVLGPGQGIFPRTDSARSMWL